MPDIDSPSEQPQTPELSELLGKNMDLLKREGPNLNLEQLKQYQEFFQAAQKLMLQIIESKSKSQQVIATPDAEPAKDEPEDIRDKDEIETVTGFAPYDSKTSIGQPEPPKPAEQDPNEQKEGLTSTIPEVDTPLFPGLEPLTQNVETSPIKLQLNQQIEVKMVSDKIPPIFIKNSGNSLFVLYNKDDSFFSNESCKVVIGRKTDVPPQVADARKLDLTPEKVDPTDLGGVSKEQLLIQWDTITNEVRLKSLSEKPVSYKKPAEEPVVA